MLEASRNKSSLTLMLSFLLKIILLKEAFSFSAISVSDDMLLLSSGAMFSFKFSEKIGLIIFQNVLFSLTSLMLILL